MRRRAHKSETPAGGGVPFDRRFYITERRGSAFHDAAPSIDAVAWQDKQAVRIGLAGKLEVHIYRGDDDDDWVLEVVDQERGSTVWNDQFPTDQAALDEAMRTIDKEGIASFQCAPTQKPH